MGDKRVTVFATFRPAKGKEEALRSVLGEMATRTRNEPGNEVCNAYASGDDSAPSFHLFERYTGPEAVETHRSTEYYVDYHARLPELLETPVEVVMLREISPSDP